MEQSLRRPQRVVSVLRRRPMPLRKASLRRIRTFEQPPPTEPPLESFNELEKQLDDFANALVEVET